MKNIVLYILFGVIGGLLGGMGMGGGTLLIPLLSKGLNVAQKTAQFINLVAFIPMSLLALAVHIKNKLVVKNGLHLIVIPAILFSILGSLIATEINEDILKKIFGIFLILMGFSYLIKEIFTKKKRDR